MISDHFSDHRRVFTVLIGPNCGQNRIGIFLGHKRQQFDFVGQIQGVETQQFAGRRDLFFQGYFIFINLNANL